MEEIKIWSVDGKQASPVGPVDRFRLESDLEDILVNKPELLMEELRLVGRQTSTEGGPLDLLGVGGDGRLAVFELKRGRLSRKAVAQIIDYASYLDSLDDNALCTHISGNSGRNCIEKIEDFREWYGDDLTALKPIRMVLVGLGVDERTERMVDFLAQKGGLEISLLTFHGFDHEGKTLLARQMHGVVGSSSDGPPGTRRVDREANWRGLLERTERHGTIELFQEANEIFRAQWENPQERARTYGLGFRLRGMQSSGKLARRIYARVIPVPDGLWIQFFDRAVELCTDRFREAVQEIEFDTYPAGRKENPFQSGNHIRFKVTAQSWESCKGRISELASAVYGTLQLRSQEATAAVGDDFDDDDEDED